MSVDPNDADGGYLPFDSTVPLVPMTFIKRGVLTNLAFSPYMSSKYGVAPLNGDPRSMRISTDGPETSIDQMIASCEQGLYINRVADLRMLDDGSGAMSGTTQGGCFFVEHGKIIKAVKDLRFVDSPFVFLNNLIAIGAPQRAAFGYSPWAGEWPLPPAIVPPIMVRDFNLTRLADAI